MAEYRGKFSRPASGSSPLQNSSEADEADFTQETPQFVQAEANGQSQQFAPVQRRSGSRPVKREAEVELSEQRRRTHHTSTSKASPYAVRHPQALEEDGGGKRHSPTKTLLIAVPVLIVLVIAVYFGIKAFTSAPPAETNVEAGVAVSVYIPVGATTNDIANILIEANVIANTKTFINEVKNMGAEQSLKPGDYELTTLMDTKELVNTLVAGPLDVGGLRLTIPEGLTVEQTATQVELALGIPAAEFLARAYSANEYAAEFPFLADVYNNSLEGFLYPKTYNIPEGSDADYVIRVLLNQFVKEISGIDTSYAESKGMNLFHVITLASLIEEETAADSERALISSVIYNRMSLGMMLQIDATVIYAMGPAYTGELVSYQDLEIDSPYNTYKVIELPAGPICSPSILSIEAACHPADTNYLYYVLTSKEGFHTFCETSDEFEVAKAEYNRIFGVE